VLIAHERDAKIKRMAGKADRVLIDAPCSGLGTLRRNPDMKWRQQPEDIAELNQKQAAILDSAFASGESRWPSGVCDLRSEDENEAIVQGFWHSIRNLN
jgi:16S rRNA (cytosine967-C5)-methyltransferase